MPIAALAVAPICLLLAPLAASAIAPVSAATTGSEGTVVLTAVSWVSAAGFGLGLSGSPLPTALSANPAAPTLLPTSGGNFSFGATAARSLALKIAVTLGSAPVSTELELSIWLKEPNASGVAPAAYLVTNASANPTAFTLWWSLGPATHPIYVSSVVLLVTACPAVGGCP
jgi:hypothetical protein